MARSITRRIALTLGLRLVVSAEIMLVASPDLMLVASAFRQKAPQVAWQEAPEYGALFAPAHARDGYRISLTTAVLEDVLAGLSADGALLHAPGAWEPQNESARDAFGTAGSYNQWQMARLYGSRPTRVARGARMDRGRVVETWTLISPYPSADLRVLHPGTMRLILTVAP